MLVPFLGSVLGVLLAYSVIYGALLFVTWRRRKRVHAKTRELIEKFLSTTERAERIDEAVTGKSVGGRN